MKVEYVEKVEPDLVDPKKLDSGEMFVHPVTGTPCMRVKMDNDNIFAITLKRGTPLEIGLAADQRTYRLKAKLVIEKE